MAILEIFDKAAWPIPSNFLQSWDWGEFQKSVGVQVRRLLVNGNAVQVFAYKIPFGFFWYLPHAELSEEDYCSLKEFGKKERIVFFRVESFAPIERIPERGVKVRNRQPEHTIVLDLRNTQEEILRAMHPKTRYNIRLAEKKELSVFWEKDSAVFNSLMMETSARDKFTAHSSAYYSLMLNCPLIEQATVYFKNIPLASAIFIAHGATYTYLHGASADAYREYKAPHLIQWSAITRAKERGFEQYDFWGVAPGCLPDHPWSGITRFKTGFGGTRITRGAAFEMPIKKNEYFILRIARFFHIR